MKVIIQPQQPQRKTYSNLPEREQHKRERPQRAMPSQVVEEYNLQEPVEEVQLDESYTDEQASESWRNSPWTRFLLVFAVLLLGGIAYFAVGYEHDQKLESIVVEGAEQLTHKEIVALADIDRTQRFYDIDLKEITERVLKHSLVKAAYPRRETNPARIVIKVEERQPVAMMRSAKSGEVLLIDEEGKVLRPKRLSGLKDPEAMLRVPLLTGISEKDTASYLAMSRLVQSLTMLDSGHLMAAIGEMKKTTTGAYVLYTSTNQTPIFLGSPKDEPFIAALELERDPERAQERREESLFEKQVKMLSSMWQSELASTVRRGNALYVDARFDGQIIVKRRGGADLRAATPAVAQTQPDTTNLPLVLKLTNESVKQRPLAQGH